MPHSLSYPPSSCKRYSLTTPKCSFKQQQHTEDTHGSDDRFSHTSSLVGRFPNVSVDRRFLDREMLPPQQLQLLFHMLAAHLGVPDRRLNDRHPTFVLLEPGRGDL